MTGRPLVSPARKARRSFLLSLGAAGAACIGQVRAQAALLHRPVTLVVPYAAGGEADTTARRMAAALAQQLGQPMVVDNQPGASGGLAARRVLRARADGHTLMFGTTSELVVAPAVNQQLGYRASDFSLIALYGRAPMALVVRAGLGLASIDAFIDEVRRQPGRLSMGATGRQSLQALAAQSLARAADVQLLHVPYQSGSQLMHDLASGRIDAVVVPLPAALHQARLWGHGVLGTLSATRSWASPQTPTVNEGRWLKGVVSEIWAGLVAPAGLAPEVAAVLHRAVQALLADPAFHALRLGLGDVPAQPMPAADFERFVQAEDARLRELVRLAPPV